jgi:hypothetical protein
MLGTNLQNQSDFLIERKQREAPSNQPSGRPLTLSIRAEQVIVEPKPPTPWVVPPSTLGRDQTAEHI